MYIYIIKYLIDLRNVLYYRNNCCVISVLYASFIYRGQLPADAEFNFLDHAKRLDMYGVELHKARVGVTYYYILYNYIKISLIIKI